MSGLLANIWDSFNYVFYDLNDDRTRDMWPSAQTLITFLAVYTYFIKVVGPGWMKDRKPYQLKNTILIYNVFQIIASFYIFYESFFNVWIPNYNWACQPVDNTKSFGTEKMLNLVWMYLTLKLIDLLDTVFFVLRKKDRQISTLHVYHHFMMPICAWICFKYYPNGHSTLLGVINCFVHTIMYTYYLLAGLGPQYQKYLWWKRHVTTLQLVQFVIIFFHNMYPLITGCNYPRWINLVLSLSALQFVYMFGNFYFITYLKKQKK